LIPLRQRAGAGEVSLDRPSDQELQSTTDRTREAIQKKLNGLVESSKPQSVAKKPGETSYVRYTPSSMKGSHSTGRQRIIKMVEVEQDPLAPPKFKHTKVPARPPSPPPPILRSPPRKVTAQDQEDWYIPSSVSNWKNPKGFTIALDKRVASDGRQHNDVVVNDNHAKLAEALYATQRSAREELKLRQAMQEKLAQKESAEKEERLRELARRAREEQAKRPPSTSVSGERRSRSRSRSPSRRGASSDDEDDESRRRQRIREERRREAERELRMSRVGAERRVKMMAREQDRDISERVALGVAKPKPSGEAQFDSRLFGQVSVGRGYNEDQIYDKSLFAAQEAVRSIYRPRGKDSNELEDEQEILDRFANESRFEGLGSSSSKIAEPREGPVEFERDVTSSIKKDSGDQNYGITK
jgi:SNW domain-containing protein 1